MKAAPLLALLSLAACNQNLRAYQTQTQQNSDSVRVSVMSRSASYTSNEEDEILSGSDVEQIDPQINPQSDASLSPQQLGMNFSLRPSDSGRISGPQPREVTLDQKAQRDILNLYKHLDPQKIVSQKLMREAIFFFHVNRAKFSNSKVITIVDYSLPSSKKRLYVIELRSGKVWRTFVAHGSGSDRNHDTMAELFSNRPNSNATSLGGFIATTSYQGGNGYSLRMKGLSKSNSNAYARSIVIHGASYVKDAETKQGRSWGCIAIARQYNAKLINTLKGGSFIYAGVSKPELHRYQ